MTRLIVALMLIAAPAASQAVGDASKCARLGNMFGYVAQLRNMDVSPEGAREQIAKSREFDPEVIKKAINLVYFDRSFTIATPKAIQDAVFEGCYNRRSDWKPLK